MESNKNVELKRKSSEFGTEKCEVQNFVKQVHGSDMLQPSGLFSMTFQDLGLIPWLSRPGKFEFVSVQDLYTPWSMFTLHTLALDKANMRLSVFGAMQTAQCKWRNATQWRNETLHNACKTNGLYLLTTLYSQQSQNGRVNDIIAHRKFPEKFRHPTFPDKLQPYFWLSSLCYVLIFYARHDGVDWTPRRY